MFLIDLLKIIHVLQLTTDLKGGISCIIQSEK